MPILPRPWVGWCPRTVGEQSRDGHRGDPVDTTGVLFERESSEADCQVCVISGSTTIPRVMFGHGGPIAGASRSVVR